MAITPSQWSHVLTIPESYTPSAATSGQTLVITESVIAKLSVGDQTTFWSNVQNGGGDVRICTDSAGTNQLPVEIVSLDNVAETCVIWTRKVTYAGNGELYVFIGKAGETQPAVTDPFGRNAVWQDEIAVYHFKNDASDSTVNGHDGNVVGASLQSGGGYEFTGTDRIELPSAVDGASNLASFVFVWENNGSTAGGHVYDTSAGSGDGYDINYRDNRMMFQVSYNTPDPDREAGPPLGPSDSNEHIAIAYRANDSVNLYLDGINYQGDSFLDSIPINGTMAAPFIGNQANSADPFGAGRVLKSFRVRTHKSVEYYNTEYANQSDPASFYGTPTIATTGGGGAVDKTIEVPLVTPSSTIFQPEITKDKLIQLSNITPTENVRNPSFLQELRITLDSIESGVSIRNLLLLKDKLIELSSKLSSAIVYDQELRLPKNIQLDTLSSEEVMYVQEIIGGFRPLPEIRMYNAEGYGMHIRTGEELKRIIVELSKRIDILEGR